MGLMDSLKGMVRAKSGVTPLQQDELIERLLGLNHNQVPFKVENSEENDLLVEWKIADASWYEMARLFITCGVLTEGLENSLPNGRGS